MKRTALPQRTKRIERKTRLRNRGGTSFKLTPDDKAQWKWMKPMTEELGPCDCECGRWGYRQRAHLHARGNGGRVLNNIVLLLPLCHSLQEKRMRAFVAELAAEGRPVDLHAKARGHTAQWRKETGRG